MKPGDLIRLCHDSNFEAGTVTVAAIPLTHQRAYDHGTLAIFLGEYREIHPYNGAETKMRILVEGMVGWIYESECEAVND